MKKTLKYLTIPIIGIVFYYVFATNEANYEDTISEKHKSRIHFLINSSSSPVEDKVNFKHPGFFPISKKYRINAKVVHNPKTEQFALELSNGKVDTYLHYGIIEFEYEGKEQSLVLFQHLEKTSEFLLPFGDQSNGSSTYGSGRHLPIDFRGGENIILDFNLAENPYCAYNHGYICPLPPTNNKLNIPIEAGEKSPK